MEAERPQETSNAPSYQQWLMAPQQQPGPVTSNDSDNTNVMDLDKIMSNPENTARASGGFSMDDLEVAKALTGLREASPAHSTTTTLTAHTLQPQSPTSRPQPEPLLSLLTSQHPLVATAINNSLSAYTTSKTYSPRFRQGAEFVERNIASPVVNTVGTAGRISGVETGVRWWLQRRNSASDTRGPNKRQRVDSDSMDVEKGLSYRSRAPSDLSQGEFLPPYDSNRSPVYEEYAVTPAQKAEQAPDQQNWPTRLVINTSGLGVAMSEESLRSLRYCLSWLRWANTHLSHVLLSLQSVLSEYERSQAQANSWSGTASHESEAPVSPSNTDSPPTFTEGAERPPRDPAVITSHLAALKAETVKTLKSALHVVSTYAGGALPENARSLVRRHLISLPMRFRVAQDATGSPEATGEQPEVVSGTQRAVVLAREGLDMITQVSGVVDGTIISAEEWCERLGRKRPAQNGDLRVETEKSSQIAEKEVIVEMPAMTNGEKQG